jgi:hypothetical protein
VHATTHQGQRTHTTNCNHDRRPKKGCNRRLNKRTARRHCDARPDPRTHEQLSHTCARDKRRMRTQRQQRENTHTFATFNKCARRKRWLARLRHMLHLNLHGHRAPQVADQDARPFTDDDERSITGLQIPSYPFGATHNLPTESHPLGQPE